MLTEPAAPNLPENVRRLYPFRTRLLTVDGQRMSFVDEGASDAPPVVLLHGYPTWSFLYRNVIPKLAERFRVIAPDLVGFGMSDKPRESSYHTLDRHIHNVSALIEALGLKKITLVLHDWGGPIGLGYATEHASNIARLILSNTWASVPPAGVKFKPPLYIRVARGRFARLFYRRMSVFVPMAMKKATARRLSTDVIDAYKLPFARSEDRAALPAFPAGVPFSPSDTNYARMAEIQSKLKLVTAHADFLWGVKDPVLGAKVWPYLLRDALPNAGEPVFLPNASHFVAEDAPEQIVDKVLEIFKPKPAPAAKPLLNILQ